MSTTLVAVIINLIAAGVIVGGIFAGRRDGIRVAGIKAAVTLIGGVGIYFLVPTIIDGLNTIHGFEEFVDQSFGFTVLNSLIVAVGALLCFVIGSVVGSIVKHSIIKGLKKNKSSKSKVRLAKAINKQSEKDIKKKETIRLKAKFNADKTWYTKLSSEIVAGIVSVILAFVIVIPFKYIAQVIVNNNADKQFLLDGYRYTINGVIDELDFGVTELIARDETAAEEEIIEESQTETHNEEHTEEPINNEEELEVIYELDLGDTINSGDGE